MIMADLECLIDALRGLEAVIHNNQAKTRAAVKTIHDGQDGIESAQAEMKSTVSAILQTMVVARRDDLPGRSGGHGFGGKPEEKRDRSRAARSP